MDASAIVGIRWVHVYEEDAEDGAVYRPRHRTRPPVETAARSADPEHRRLGHRRAGGPDDRLVARAGAMERHARGHRVERRRTEARRGGPDITQASAEHLIELGYAGRIRQTRPAPAGPTGQASSPGRKLAQDAGRDAAPLSKSAGASNGRRSPGRVRAPPGDPLYRPLRIYTLDPSVSHRIGGVATVNVPYERLQKGPHRIALRDRPDGRRRRCCTPAPLDLDDPYLLMAGGHTPSPGNGQFALQMTYAVCSLTYAAFRRALGRDISWALRRGGRHGRTRLVVRPFGMRQRNAGYSREAGDLSFGYFRAPATSPPASRCRGTASSRRCRTT